MLDDHHGITQISQAAQRSEKALVIPLMESDTRLVQHIEDTGKPRSDLCGQTNALGLATGECPAFPIQRQITKADLHKKSQPRSDLPDKIIDNLPLGVSELQGGENLMGTPSRKGAEFLDIPFTLFAPKSTPHGDTQNLRAKTSPLACPA